MYVFFYMAAEGRHHCTNMKRINSREIYYYKINAKGIVNSKKKDKIILKVLERKERLHVRCLVE